MRKHRLPSSQRQLAPSVFILTLLIFGLAALFSPLAGLLAMGLFTAYLTAATLAAVSATKSYDPANLALVVLSFASMHFAYGLGLFHSFVDFFVLRRKTTSRMSELTR